MFSLTELRTIYHSRAIFFAVREPVRFVFLSVYSLDPLVHFNSSSNFNRVFNFNIEFLIFYWNLVFSHSTNVDQSKVLFDSWVMQISNILAPLVSYLI